MAIGIFDSGLGGLTVVAEIKKVQPRADLVYLGDTARVPYGSRSPETIIKFSLECANFLMNQGVECIVIACNTASAYALETIKKSINIPVYDVITPAKIEATKYLNVGVIGTKATIKSGAYSVPGRACPLLVPLVEEGEITGEIAEAVVKKYLQGFDVEALILGCTHYPYLIDVISKYTNAKLINPGECLARNLPKFEGVGKEKYYVTDLTESFLAKGLMTERVII